MTPFAYAEPPVICTATCQAAPSQQRWIDLTHCVAAHGALVAENTGREGGGRGRGSLRGSHSSLSRRSISPRSTDGSSTHTPVMARTCCNHRACHRRHQHSSLLPATRSVKPSSARPKTRQHRKVHCVCGAPLCRPRCDRAPVAGSGAKASCDERRVRRPDVGCTRRTDAGRAGGGGGGGGARVSASGAVLAKVCRSLQSTQLPRFSIG